MSVQVKNPILPGFYPDPSICRAGDDYFLVSSSFSYFPGVPIFHSSDLAHWKQIGHILSRPSQLNITDQGISDGIYAPALRYHEGIFYLMTTFVGGGGNFFVTAANAEGPWSDPVWLPEIEGIDPCFFFDQDGRAYIINNGPAPENRPLYEGHRAIYLQEFDLTTYKLTGIRKCIIDGGTDIQQKPVWIEAPHLYKKDGYYYLMAAEGGTYENHSEVIFRAKDIFGPYESITGNPILTQRDLPLARSNPITCAGHADLVQTTRGDWFAVFLGCQPYEENYYNNGRQTYLLPVDWSGEWPVILSKGKTIDEAIDIPGVIVSSQKTFAAYSANWKDDFNEKELGLDWLFMRTPKDNWKDTRNGCFLMQARNVKITDRGNPSFIGRRLQHNNSEMSISLKLEKGKAVEAGLVAFQDEAHFFMLMVKAKDDRYYLDFYSPQSNGEINALVNTEIAGYDPNDFIYLRMIIKGGSLESFYSLNNSDWQPFALGDAKQLSTAVVGGFTGTLYGLYAYAQSPATAFFDWASYREL